MNEKEKIPVIDAELVDTYQESWLVEHDQKRIAGAFVHSFGHSFIQGPIDGVTEIVNKFAGSKVVPQVEIVKKPEKAEVSTNEWHAQKMGSGAGLIAAGLVIIRLMRGR